MVEQPIASDLKNMDEQSTASDLKNIVVIGSTGAGKSSTLNTLCGLQDKFLVSSKEQSLTIETTTKVLLWRGT
jgi:predicted GTPase